MNAVLQDLCALPPATIAELRFVLCDIDDTLTHDGRLPACSFAALERLHEAGLKVVPITGGAAGWCDMIARYWPVEAVIGESGAFYFRKNPLNGRVERRYWLDVHQRRSNRAELLRLGDAIVAAEPGAALAADQSYRECDLAIDYAQDVPRLTDRAVKRIVTRLNRAGVTTRISSIHVNAWFGDYDKSRMACVFLAEIHGLDADNARRQALFVGDAPNDSSMFAHFPHSVGVANIRRFTTAVSPLPPYVTKAEGGHGFAELAEYLLSQR